MLGPTRPRVRASGLRGPWTRSTSAPPALDFTQKKNLRRVCALRCPGAVEIAARYVRRAVRRPRAAILSAWSPEKLTPREKLLHLVADTDERTNELTRRVR